MFVVDTNVLVHAVDSLSHRRRLAVIAGPADG